MKNEPPPEPAREGDEVRQEKAADDGGRNRKDRSRKMPESEKWSRTHIANRLMVWTTALVAFATLFYAVATAFQVYLFHKNAAETARQTDRLIDASEKQATVIREALEETKRSNREAAERAERTLNATEKQADASSTQANVSERMARQNEGLIEATRSQANTSQVAARAAEESAKISKRAYEAGLVPRIYFLGSKMKEDIEPSKSPVIQLLVANGGGKAERLYAQMAAVVRPYGFSGELSTERFGPPSSVMPLEQGATSTFTIVFDMTLSQEQIKSVRDTSTQMLIFYGWVRYEDTLKRPYLIPICRFYSRINPPELGVCSESIRVQSP